MSDAVPVQAIHTRIWLEEPEPHDPFAVRSAHCHGYDVFGQMLGRARWADMVFLLFRGEAPSGAQAALLDALAVALANPGPRDPSVHAAMCGGVGGSTAAASLMAALGVGAGQSGGAREVYLALQGWGCCRLDLSAWSDHWAALLRVSEQPELDVWPAVTNPPGFEPHASQASTVVCQALATMAALSPGAALPWLLAQRPALERAAGHGLAMTGVAAAALADLGMSPEQGEMLYLILRLPGAAAHALEQGQAGFKQFPFPPLDLQDDPAARRDPR